MEKDKNLYVISADLETVDQSYIKRSELDNFRNSITEDLSLAGKNVKWVEYSRLKNGIAALIDSSDIPKLSLDMRYVERNQVETTFGVSRSIDLNLLDTGYDSRINHPSIEYQLKKVASDIIGREVILIDDVIFTGHNICWVADKMNQLGLDVRAVYAGIAIGEAAARLSERDIQLEYVEYFEDVDDEICERDFAIVEGSGRKILGLNKSALYFDPIYGNPEKWASLPESIVETFFISSLERNNNLLNTAVKLSRIGDYLGYDPELTVDENITLALNR